ncbi:MAG: S-methyl-5'-thioinosine phosphorylase [Candidatus Thiodiazotropha sp. (ex Lucinoma borealis)]|nr:S-methyl-5'-thioinosine phosphorylase [Candidatus Thiodiazotropha sp. (ex Lucinoma borealis)]
MTKLAIIGGTGLDEMPDLEITHREVCHTPFGQPSAALTHGRMSDREVVFLPRHGASHMIPPHLVNYRANLWALRHLGVETVLGVAAVGGITSEMGPSRIIIPDQIIDYTFGRDHTIYDTDLSHITHIDFTQPYCENLRQELIEAGRLCGANPIGTATYGATQGPRLESAAEIVRMERDGCDIVGMTGMPEAALARELNLCYASCSVVSNWAAGKVETSINMKDIEKNLIHGMDQVKSLLVTLLRLRAH